MYNSISELIKLKTEILFHDPLHKSFLIDIAKTLFKDVHEREAKSFRNSILNGTRFYGAPREDVYRVVKICDFVSAAVERRLIDLRGWPKDVYIGYSNLHNIFDPDPNNYLNLASRFDINKFGKIYKDVVDKLNSLFKKIDVYAEDDVTLYNVIYTALESTWYAYGLPPSLADTRTPTHTVFDHLYAATTMANIVDFDRDEYRFKGFYVVIDFPGIQRFIGSSRKAGDFWASSWLLSNTIWGIIDSFVKIYGFDIALSPTPRLNPYSLKSLKINKNEVEELKDIFAKAYGVSKSDIEWFMNQPIIPATTTMILPSIDFKTCEEVAEKISKAYLNSWRIVVDSILRGLNPAIEGLKKGAAGYLYKKLKQVEDIISMPPQGIRIFVLDVEKIFRAIASCLINRDIDSCKVLGLDIDLDKVGKKIKGSEIDIIAILLWHLISTKALELVNVFGIAKKPIPRPFWTYQDNTLKPIFTMDKDSWSTCILCGLEPMVLKLSKAVVKSDGREEIWFSDEVVKELEKDVDIEEFRKHFKPGEALGPYCLLKRAIYIVNRGKIRLVSTDDIALEAISHIVLNLDRKYSFLRKVAEKAYRISSRGTEEQWLSLLKGLLMPSAGESIKDLELSAKTFNQSYEEFVNTLNRSMYETCQEFASDKMGEDFIKNAVDSFIDVMAKGLSKDVVNNMLSMFVEEPKTIRVLEFCKIFFIPTSYAIARADGDNIGYMIRGETITYEKYLEKLKTIIIKNALEYSIEKGIISKDIYQQVVDVVKDSFDLMKDIFKDLGFKYIPVSPARTALISLSLIVSAIRDLNIVRDGYGVTIFSGGDDILALLPPQSALRTVIELRKSFSDKYFTDVGNIVIPTIPTGRSVSVRFSNLMDLMNLEFEKSLELLENVAKESRWSFSGVVYTKDTLIVSDSRSGVFSLLPLHRDKRHLNEVALLLSILTSLGILSPGTPNDFIDVVKDPSILTSNALKRFAIYVLKRNIATAIDRKGYAEKLLNAISPWLNEASNTFIKIDEEKMNVNLLTQFMNLIAIMRRQI